MFRNRLFKKTVFGRSLKFVKLIIVVPVSIVVVVIIFSSVLDNVSKSNKSSDKKEEYIEFTDRPKTISAMNSNGTANGLNLILIDSIATNGFVKEYLTLARSSQQGELSDYQEHATVESIIGLAMGEQGGYTQSGSILPNTCLPWDSSNNSPKWEESTDVNLSKATMPVFDRIGHNEKAWTVGNYVSPYQQTASYFTNGTYKPSKMSGTGMSSSRTNGDWSYFPDELAGLDHEYCNVSGVDVSKFTDPASRLLITSENHNVGESWKDQFFGTYKGGDISQGVVELTKTFRTGFTKFQPMIAKEVIDPSLYKWVANLILMSDGWNINNRSSDTATGKTSYETMNSVNRSNCFKIFVMLGLGSTDADYQSFLDSHTKDDPNNYGHCKSAATQGTLWKDCGADGQMYMLTETGGHILSSSFMGPIYYARMLKFAGVGVDPTNPSTYMEQLKKSGEWTPSGDTDWMKNAEIDLSKMNDKRAKLLSLAYAQSGKPYVFGAKGPNSFDCSGFTSWCAYNALNLDIGGSTMAQIDNSNLEKIDQKDAKPGDLVLMCPRANEAHVVFFLKDLGGGMIRSLEARGSAYPVGIFDRLDHKEANPEKYYVRIKGIDD